jgi:hypothetical protein
MRSRLMWIPVAALLLAACATGRAGGPAEPTAQVKVENNLVPSRAVSVWLVSGAGARIRLGDVRPRRTTTLTVDQSIYPGGYQLIAETATGQTMSSQAFNLFAGAEVTWDLRNNTLLVGGTQ